MDLDKFLTIQLSLCILFAALLIRRFVMSWSHPAVVFGLFWWALTFFPLVIMWSVPINYYGTGYILAAVIAFSIPSVFMDWKMPHAAAKRRAGTAPQPHDVWRLVFFAMVAAAVACIVVNLFIQGLSLADIVTHPLKSASDYMYMRYDKKIIVNVYNQIGGVLNYVAACLGGLIVADQKSKRRSIAVFVLSFLPSLLFMVLYSDKGALFQAAAYFYGAVLVSRIGKGDLALVTKADVRAAGLALIVLIPALVFAMLARGVFRTDAAERFDSVIFYIDSYAFAHLYAFSDWIDNYLHNTTTPYTEHGTPGGGFWTFMAIGKLLSPASIVPVGYFTELYGYKSLLQSNIYTMFRGLIYDFTVTGSILFMGALGWLGALAYRQMLLFRQSPISQSFYIFLIGFIYSSYLLSLLTWSSAYVVAICITGLLLANNMMTRSSAAPLGK